LKQTIKIDDAKNHDWEDLAQDDQGNLYIADTGNNENNRKNLRIFKLKSAELKKKKVKTKEIEFSYEDQTVFPPAPDQLYFDCEAICWFKQHIYLFTKSRSWPATCNVYRIPDKPGKYVAKKVGSFTTEKQAVNKDSLNSYWITAADISPDGTRLALLSNDRVWIFSNFTGDCFFDGESDIYKLDEVSQKESICFSDNHHMYITDEQGKNKHEGRNLYQLTIAGKEHH
jgi:WD40 repeat protein